jgi:hypothetical protein
MDGLAQSAAGFVLRILDDVRTLDDFRILDDVRTLDDFRVLGDVRRVLGDGLVLLALRLSGVDRRGLVLDGLKHDGVGSRISRAHPRHYFLSFFSCLSFPNRLPHGVKQ